jgi:hypothetical protein
MSVDAQDVPCLVYATFSGRIYLYYNVTLPGITVSSLSSAIEGELEKVCSLPNLHGLYMLTDR